MPVKLLKHFFMWAAAALFAWTTIVLSGGPLRAISKTEPWPVFVLLVLTISAIFFGLGLTSAAVLFLNAGILISSFTWLEQARVSLGVSALSAISIVMANLSLTLGAYCKLHHLAPIEYLASTVEQMLNKAFELNPNLRDVFATAGLSPENILSYLPSFVICMSLLTLAIAVVSERHWLQVFEDESGQNDFGGNPIAEPSSNPTEAELGRLRLQVEAELKKIVSQFRWLSFQVWNELIYLLMLALLLTFTNHGVKSLTVVGGNLLNVVMMLYFFQGMAVSFNLLHRFRVSAFWRLVIGLVLVFQLALLVVCVGVIDYWIEFRRRLGPPMQPSTGT